MRAAVFSGFLFYNIMQHYELLYIVPVKFAGAELEKIQDKVKEIIKKADGQIDYEENLGKKKLAYVIKNNFQGFYIINEFDVETDQIKALNDKLKLTSEVLRHLIIKKKKLTEDERKKDAHKKEGKVSKMAAQFDIEKQLEDTKSVTVDKKEEPVAKKSEVETKETRNLKLETEEKEEPVAEKPKVEAPAESETKPEEVAEEKKKKDDGKIKLEDLDKKLDEIIDSDII